ncbi:MAG TPA: RDD family protein [Gemmatimonadaceae bacterium]|nr:RDD family protein [Gemmatimonadaceae bacterium]
MRYAGFWSRFVAGLIDGVVSVPVILLVLWLDGVSYAGAVISNVVGPAFIILYNVGLVAIYGGTLGKLLRGLRVLKVNGDRATWTNAWRRSAVDLTISFSAVILTLIALNRIAPDVYLAANQEARTEMVEGVVPALRWLLWAAWVWILSEFVTLLSNKKRRALHDFIGGTVVVHVAPQSLDARPGRADPQQIPARSY